MRRVIIELHANDDSEKSGDDWHERMLAKPFVGCDGLTDLSLSRERPSRASVPDSWRLAKHEAFRPGPAYGRASAAAKSWAAVLTNDFNQQI